MYLSISTVLHLTKFLAIQEEQSEGDFRQTKVSYNSVCAYQCVRVYTSVCVCVCACVHVSCVCFQLCKNGVLLYVCVCVCVTCCSYFQCTDELAQYSLFAQLTNESDDYVVSGLMCSTVHLLCATTNFSCCSLLHREHL